MKMRWHKAVQGFLFNLVLVKWLFLVGTEMLEQVGTPLSDAEYDEFFKTFNDPHRVGAVCFLRAVYGCKQPLIQMVDRYENHGILPEGRVCSNSAKRPSFPDFCTFTLYRCAMRKYFMKRVLCPGETIETSNDTQGISQQMEPLHNLSAILQSLPKLLHSSPAPVENESIPTTTSRSESPMEVVNAMSISAAVVMEVSSDVTTSAEETSSVTLSSPAESVLDLLFETTTNKESSKEVLTEAPAQSLSPTEAATAAAATTTTTTIEPLPEVHSATHATPVAEPEFSPEQHTTSVPAAPSTPSAPEPPVTTSPTTTTTEPVLDLLLESSLELLSPTAAKTDIENLLENLTASHVVTEASTTSTEETTHAFHQPLATATAPPESIAQFSTSISSAETMSEVSTILDAPTTNSSSELITPIVTAAITTGGTISTHFITTGGKKKNSEEPLPTSSSAMAPPSELLADHTITAAPVEDTYDQTTCINHLHQSPVAVCPQHTSPPSAATPVDLAEHSPGDNSSMGIVVVSTFIHRKPEGMLGLVPLLRIGLSSSETQQEDGIPRPQQLPSHDLKRLFLEMQDSRVQHLMRVMRDLTTKGEIRPKRKLKATSLQLLRVLNLPNQQRKSKRSMRLKR